MPIRPPSFRPAGHQTAAQRKADLDRNRGSASKRGYDRDWQRLRRAYLAQNPLCVDCQAEGRTTAAEVVDHIAAVADRPDLRLTWSNLRGLCKSHHDSRTARDQGLARGKRQG